MRLDAPTAPAFEEGSLRPEDCDRKSQIMLAETRSPPGLRVGSVSAGRAGGPCLPAGGNCRRAAVPAWATAPTACGCRREAAAGGPRWRARTCGTCNGRKKPAGSDDPGASGDTAGHTGTAEHPKTSENCRPG